MIEKSVSQTIERLRLKAGGRGLGGAIRFLDALAGAAQEKPEGQPQPEKISRLHYTLD
jgi:hypothetical protein